MLKRLVLVVFLLLSVAEMPTPDGLTYPEPVTDGAPNP